MKNICDDYTRIFSQAHIILSNPKPNFKLPTQIITTPKIWYLFLVQLPMHGYFHNFIMS